MPKAKKSAKKSSKKPVKKSTRKPVKTASRKPVKKAASKPVKFPKAKRLPKKDLDLYKKMLLLLRSKIAGDLQSIEGDSLSGNQPGNGGELSDVADMATDNYDRELNIGLASNEQQILNDIDVALKRIEDGTYGICEIYGTPIPSKRLLAMPYTRLSMKAQEEEEKHKRRL
jgi:RNA polymerase-binding protein DksA